MLELIMVTKDEYGHSWDHNDLFDYEWCKNCKMIRTVYNNLFWYAADNWKDIYGRKLYSCDEILMKDILE